MQQGRTATLPLRRRTGARVIGGVAGGVADHLAVDAFRVRLAFVVLAALGGAGVVAYGLLWAFTQPGLDVAPAPPGERRRALGLAVLGLGLAGIASLVLDGSYGIVALPILVIAVGAALVWREADTSRLRRTRPGVLTVTRVLTGATLVVIGLGVVVLAQVDLGAVRTGVLAVLATLLGVALLSVPFWLRLARELAEERRVRIRTEERADIASHLHDSVLQTLALIQKHADTPHEVNRLARAQERDLRAWLFEAERTGEVAASLATELRRVAAGVEDDHGVTVRPVIVGDTSVSPAVGALLGAAREAMINAAKHSGEPEVAVYAEVEEERVTVFVRDRGTGFDPAAVAADRQGLQRSVRDRMARHGGTAEVISSPGTGTEIRLCAPVEHGDV